MKKIVFFVLIAILTMPILASAQSSVPKVKHDSYLKFGLDHWQGNISSFNYKFTGVDLEVETYFNRNIIQLSGWSVGYRKEQIRRLETGQLFDGKVFRAFDLKGVDLKTAGGVEWGLPPLTLDKTRFADTQGDDLSYQHIYPVRNSNIPHLGDSVDGVLHPFAELSVVKRKGQFLFELGVRDNIMKMGIDSFDIKNDQINYSSKVRTRHMPSIFVNIGLKMG